MRITVEEDDQTTVFENVTDFSYVIRVVEAKVIQKDYSRSVGDLSWLIGKVFYALEFLKREHFYPQKMQGVIRADT